MANISGWYYDNQLNNPLTSVSLHANMECVDGEDGKRTWIEITDKDPEDEKLGLKDDKGNVRCYSKTPICQSICNEDFSVNISNDWSDFGVDNIAGSIWNTIRQVGPYSSVIESAISELVKTAEDEEKTYDKETATWSQKINHGINQIAKNYKTYFGNLNQKDFFNRALIMQGTKFAYYGGTNVNFSNLGMRFTIFPKFENGVPVSVLDQVQNLYKYLIGSTEDFELDKAPDDVQEIAKDYIKWQKAPGGFEPDLKNYDVIQPGTLKLKIGSLYAIPNLVCNDANFVFSRQMVKFPEEITNISYEGNNAKVSMSPLFCDVSLALRPVSKYTEKLLLALVNNTRDTHTEMESKVGLALSEEIKSIKTQYGL